MKKEPQGHPVESVMSWLDHYLRQHRLDDAQFAKMINETEWTMQSLRAGRIEPPQKLLDIIGWCRFEDSYYKRVLVTEVRYMPKKEAMQDDE